MKKIWILEKLVDRDEMRKSYDDMKALLEEFKKEGVDEIKIKNSEMFLLEKKKEIDENPNGVWYGFEGKTIYRQFCDDARDAIRRNPGCKFRVVEAKIPDDSKYWLDYEPTRVNEGVLRYLMATK